jgi:class 3 adenylate cyclase
LPKKSPELHSDSKHSNERATAFIGGFFNVLNTAVERFGWVGVILAGIGLFVVFYASPEQKRQIIDMYILGKGTPYAVLVMGLVCLLTLFAQKYRFDIKLEAISKRLEASEAEKARLATQQIETKSQLMTIEASRKHTGTDKKK